MAPDLLPVWYQLLFFCALILSLLMIVLSKTVFQAYLPAASGRSKAILAGNLTASALSLCSVCDCAVFRPASFGDTQ
jgi:hypothetical protein